LNKAKSWKKGGKKSKGVYYTGKKRAKGPNPLSMKKKKKVKRKK